MNDDVTELRIAVAQLAADFRHFVEVSHADADRRDAQTESEAAVRAEIHALLKGIAAHLDRERVDDLVEARVALRLREGEAGADSDAERAIQRVAGGVALAGLRWVRRNWAAVIGLLSSAFVSGWLARHFHG